LYHVWNLASRLGMNYQVAKRQPGAEVPLPCIVHRKLEHCSALTRFDNGRYRIEDPTFSEGWISPAALDEEASGLFLVPGGPLPPGWRPATPDEASSVWGRSTPSSTDLKLPPCGPKSGGN